MTVINVNSTGEYGTLAKVDVTMEKQTASTLAEVTVVYKESDDTVLTTKTVWMMGSEYIACGNGDTTQLEDYSLVKLGLTKS